MSAPNLIIVPNTPVLDEHSLPPLIQGTPLRMFLASSLSGLIELNCNNKKTFFANLFHGINMNLWTYGSWYGRGHSISIILWLQVILQSNSFFGNYEIQCPKTPFASHDICHLSKLLLAACKLRFFYNKNVWFTIRDRFAN